MGSSPAGRAISLPPDLLTALGPLWPRVRDASRPLRLVAAWATIDLDRAEGERLDDSVSLGARCRLVHDAEAGEAVLAEPCTEGAVAAFLARHGEGWAALFLVADRDAPVRLRAAGIRLSGAVTGPLGPERRVLGTARHGPYLVLSAAD